MALDLTQDDELKKAVLAVQPKERNADWVNGLAGFLKDVREADLETRRTAAFQQKLWEENWVSGVGMGTVDISTALDDPAFRDWLAEESMKPVPEDADARLAFFQQLYDQLAKRLRGYAGRVAWVKIFRVLAALYPRYFSTITDRSMALECHRAWFGKRRKVSAVARQLQLMERLDELLDPCADDEQALAERMTVPWFVYEAKVQSSRDDAVAETMNSEGNVELKPLPALQRRKGFTGIKGGLGALSSALAFVVEGVTREELLDFLRAEFPDYRENSLRTLINILKNEFYVIEENDGVFTQTARGELFLDTQDPQELVPLFITRTLGVDHVLCALRENGPMSSTDLVTLLQQVNPGWTSEYSPRAMLKWLRDFGLLQANVEGIHSLTESGESWAAQIHWTPEFLETVGDTTEEVELTEQPAKPLDISGIDQGQLIGSVVDETAFATSIVRQLHLGLWAHDRRHFAILAGLSGSGKTMLAQRYGRALVRQFDVEPESHVFVQAIQPGWYDSSPIFGYINPLTPDIYARSPLLDFLLKAAKHPDEPFVVILDEMNLSHPEQYFAPVLSTMESGDVLRLHNEGSVFDGIPGTIPYPANVAFIGTVNMDETTHGISDKVLDRAFTIEFWDINLDDYPNWESFGVADADLKLVRGCLEDLLETLYPERLHFGWRTVEDVLSYVGLAGQLGEFDVTAALDEVIYARVLPKVRGAESNRLHDALGRTTAVLDKYELKRSSQKLRSLQQDLADTGMMRFWR